jgi:hypothetical protein
MLYRNIVKQTQVQHTQIDTINMTMESQDTKKEQALAALAALAVVDNSMTPDGQRVQALKMLLAERR